MLGLSGLIIVNLQLGFASLIDSTSSLTLSSTSPKITITQCFLRRDQCSKSMYFAIYFLRNASGGTQTKVETEAKSQINSFCDPFFIFFLFLTSKFFLTTASPLFINRQQTQSANLPTSLTSSAFPLPVQFRKQSSPNSIPKTASISYPLLQYLSKSGFHCCRCRDSLASMCKTGRRAIARPTIMSMNLLLQSTNLLTADIRIQYLSEGNQSKFGETQ